jgi:hypothetical protein
MLLVKGLEVRMKKFQFATVILVVSVLGLSGFVTSTAHPQDATPVPEETKDVTDIKDGFSGNWIAYSVVPLKDGASTTIKPGLRVKITADSYAVADATCADPKYTIKTITKNDFLQGNTPRNSAEEFYEDQFPLLSTDCTGVSPADLALTSYHSLTALVDDCLIFFEQDSSVTVGGVDVTTDLIFESSEKPLYEIHGQVPVVNEPSAEKLNPLLKMAVTEELDGFKKNFTDWDIPPEMANAVSFMWVRYDAPLITSQIASFRFYVDYYMAGAAHPNHYFKVVNFDLEKGKAVTTKSLFKDLPKALTSLSKLCKASLDKPDFPLFEEGLEVKEENFKNWNLTENGLRLSFDPYQVAPYAAGPQEVLIPYSELHSLANTADGFGAYIAQH